MSIVEVSEGVVERLKRKLAKADVHVIERLEFLAF